jgi:hypothetical protein
VKRPDIIRKAELYAAANRDQTRRVYGKHHLVQAHVDWWEVIPDWTVDKEFLRLARELMKLVDLPQNHPLRNRVFHWEAYTISIPYVDIATTLETLLERYYEQEEAAGDEGS